jgi:hypothetical protein
VEPKNVTIPALKLVFLYLKVISIVDKVLLVILNKILCNIYSANLMGRGGGGVHVQHASSKSEPN